MTERLIKDEREAIEAIKSNMPTSGYYMLREALEMAIQALEEIQQYRSIGTVEELKTWCDLFGLDGFKKLEEYQKNGTVEELREAKEKQNPKKPDYEGDGYADGQLVYDTWICPNCGTKYEVDHDDYEHCPKCGQAIDLTEEGDE